MAVITIAVGAWLFLSSGSDDNSGQSSSGKETVALSESDRDDVEFSLGEFVAQSGTFGLRDELFNTKGAVAIYKSIESGQESTFLTTRSESYAGVRELIHPDSSLNLSESTVSSWSEELTSHGTLISVSSQMDEVSVPSKGFIKTLAGEKLRSVEVEITYSSTVELYSRTDWSDRWGGSFDKRVLTLKERSAKVTLVQVGEDWKVYAFEGPKAFVFVFLENPSWSEFYQKYSSNFVNNGRVFLDDSLS